VIIELCPYRGPRSPLDLVDVEHIFGCLFEAFRFASQAVRTDTSASEDAQSSKRTRAPTLKRMIVPKYTMILFLFILSLTFNLYSDNIAVCRKSSVSVLPKSTDKLMASPKAGGSTKKEDESSTVHQLVPSVVAAPIPSSSEGNNLTVLSTADV
jgi:hypothetical protein